MKGFSCIVLAVAALALGACASSVSLLTKTPSLESMTEASEELVTMVWIAYSASNVVFTYRASQGAWLVSRRIYY